MYRATRNESVAEMNFCCDCLTRQPDNTLQIVLDVVPYHF